MSKHSLELNQSPQTTEEWSWDKARFSPKEVAEMVMASPFIASWMLHISIAELIFMSLKTAAKYVIIPTADVIEKIIDKINNFFTPKTTTDDLDEDLANKIQQAILDALKELDPQINPENDSATQNIHNVLSENAAQASEENLLIKQNMSSPQSPTAVDLWINQKTRARSEYRQGTANENQFRLMRDSQRNEDGQEVLNLSATFKQKF